MKIAFFNLILIVCLVNVGQADIPLVINEFMASNRNSEPDPQGQYDDWIELYNYGSSPVHIGGMYLSDDLSVPAKWQIPIGTTVLAGGYLLIWADEDTSDTTDAELHANFKLSADGEEIGLFDRDGITLIDSIIFPEQTTDISYGRDPNANGNWHFLTVPTPGMENVGGYLGQVEAPMFSHSRGFYDVPFTLTIATETEGADIYYSLDGSNPSVIGPRDVVFGTLYTGPISITGTTCLRTVAIKSGWKPSKIETHTYLFLDDVIAQPNVIDGYPAVWGPYTDLGGNAIADYEMDPEITEDPSYASLMKEALLSIPTMSIVTDRDNLFSYSTDPVTGGIYIYTGPPLGSTTFGLGSGWERPVSVEFFNLDGSEEFQVDCGLRLQGGHSRRPEKSPKHSFRFVFKSKYGPPKLNYPLFGDDAATELNTITLRGGFCNSWHHWSPDQRERAQYLRDTWAKDTQLAMGSLSGRGLFVHLYLNGLYWGLYNPTERIDREYAASYLGGDDTDFDVIKDYTEVVDGNNVAWNRMMYMANAGLVSNEAYQRIQGNNPDGTPNPDYEPLLDVVNLIDYMILNLYGGNTDWDHHNWITVRSRVQPGKGYQFFSWDAEHILENVNHNMINENNSNCPSRVYQKLRENADFRLLFADRIRLHFFNGGTLTPQSAKERWMQRAEEIELAVIAESARWGDYRRDVHSWQNGPYFLYTKDEFWIPERDWLLNVYFSVRTHNVLSQFRNDGLYPRVDAPVFHINGSHQHGGQVTKYSSLLVPNITGTIFYTLDGTDPRLPGTSQEYGERVVLISEDAGKRVLVPTGSVSDSWKGGRYYSDISWLYGTGGVGYDTGSEYMDFIDIDLYDQMYRGQTSCYIRIPFTTQQPEQFEVMTLRIRYDDGFVAYINGTEVARRNFEGTPTWNSSAETTHTDSEAVNFEDIDISSYIDELGSGSNILAIHGLNASLTSSDFLISAELVAYEALEDDSSSQTNVSQGVLEYTGPITLTESTHIKARALSGNTWSALNEATYAVGPVAENVRITEIMYHPQNDPNDEFIELTNTGDETINLNLVKFTNGIDFTFPSLELAPGEYVVAVQDRTAFETLYGTDITIAGKYTGRLNNAGEKIELEDAIGRTILEFDYKDGWRSITDGRGFSLTIIEPANPDPNSWDDGNYWRASADTGGSPGRDDSGIVPDPGSVVISELLANTPDGEPDWIELYNTTGTPIDIGGWFLSDNDSNPAKYEISTGTVIGPYGYIVFYQDTHFDNPSDPGSLVGFALSDDGESVYLSSGRDGVITGYRDVEDFGASATGVSFGRYFKSSTGNYNFVAMSETTAGSANSYPKVGPVVISEIMYNPDWPVGGSYTNQQYEYIELCNISSEPVTLYSEATGLPWRFTDGVEYTFAVDEPVIIPAGGYLLLVRHPAAFSWRYPDAPSESILGPYDGNLSNAGESLELSMPGEVNGVGEGYYIRVDRVNYSDGSHPENCPGGVDLWPSQADGDGYSLTRKALSDYGNDPGNWLAASPTPAE